MQIRTFLINCYLTENSCFYWPGKEQFGASQTSTEAMALSITGLSIGQKTVVGGKERSQGCPCKVKSATVILAKKKKSDEESPSVHGSKLREFSKMYTFHAFELLCIKICMYSN